MSTQCIEQAVVKPVELASPENHAGVSVRGRGVAPAGERRVRALWQFSKDERQEQFPIACSDVECGSSSLPPWR